GVGDTGLGGGGAVAHKCLLETVNTIISVNKEISDIKDFVKAEANWLVRVMRLLRTAAAPRCGISQFGVDRLLLPPCVNNDTKTKRIEAAVGGMFDAIVDAALIGRRIPASTAGPADGWVGFGPISEAPGPLPDIARQIECSAPTGVVKTSDGCGVG